MIRCQWYSIISRDGRSSSGSVDCLLLTRMTSLGMGDQVTSGWRTMGRTETGFESYVTKAPMNIVRSILWSLHGLTERVCRIGVLALGREWAWCLSALRVRCPLNFRYGVRQAPA